MRLSTGAWSSVRMADEPSGSSASASAGTLIPTAAPASSRRTSVGKENPVRGQDARNLSDELARGEVSRHRVGVECIAVDQVEHPAPFGSFDELSRIVDIDEDPAAQRKVEKTVRCENDLRIDLDNDMRCRRVMTLQKCGKSECSSPRPATSSTIMTPMLATNTTAWGRNLDALLIGGSQPILPQRQISPGF
jgi:hypothetical protein